MPTFAAGHRRWQRDILSGIRRRKCPEFSMLRHKKNHSLQIICYGLFAQYNE
nr:MAG TPA: hypothetical protein [Caudoviricetes sp.]